jgi:hypothetical protein
MIKRYRAAWIAGLIAFVLTQFMAVGSQRTTAIGAVGHGLAEGLWVGLIWFAIVGAVQFILYRFRVRYINRP